MPSLLFISPTTTRFVFPRDNSVNNCLGADEESRSFPARGRKDGPERRRARGNRVLLIGRLRELALYRAEVLRSHGFRVLTPRTPQEATELIRSEQFDIAVLTYTLSSDLVEELAELIRQYCPRAPLIAITDTRRVDPKIFADQVVLAEEGPAALIASLPLVSSDS
jgi:hypothetical protein